MSPQRGPVRPSSTGTPDLTGWALAALGGLLGLGAIMWVGAALACIATRRGLPDGGLTAALSSLAHPAEPAAGWPTPAQLPGPLAYWAATGLVCVLVTAVGLGGLRLYRRLTAPARRGSASRLWHLPGMADPSEVHRVAGRQALRTRAAIVRPSLDSSADPEQVGYRLGALRSRELWCTLEDSVLLVGPPRMGKGVHLVIPWVLDAPGPVVATSTRPDTLAVTLRAQQRVESLIVV